MTNLSLLETYGKNAWLVANWQLEAEVERVAREEREVKTELEKIEEERRVAMEAGRAEEALLEEAWRKAVGGLVQVQVATEDLRNKVEEMKRGEVQLES
jgi:pre-mRNA-splicing factor SPF27